jgi:hypothetical protein
VSLSLNTAVGHIKREMWVVGQHSSNPDHDAAGRRPDAINTIKIFGAAYRKLLAGACGEFAIDAHRGVDDDMHTDDPGVTDIGVSVTAVAAAPAPSYLPPEPERGVW